MVIIIVYCPHFSLSKASRTLSVGLSPGRTGLIPMPFRVEFVEGQVTLIKDFLLVIGCSPTNIILAMLHTHPFIYHWRCINIVTDAHALSVQTDSIHDARVILCGAWGCHTPLSYTEFKNTWSSTSIIDTSSTNSS